MHGLEIKIQNQQIRKNNLSQFSVGDKVYYLHYDRFFYNERSILEPGWIIFVSDYFAVSAHNNHGQPWQSMFGA
jgi:hypothetical protein